MGCRPCRLGIRGRDLDDEDVNYSFHAPWAEMWKNEARTESDELLHHSTYGGDRVGLDRVCSGSGDIWSIGNPRL